MIRILALVTWGFAASTATAQEATSTDTIAQWDGDRTLAFDATLIDLDDLIWQARPVVVFADSPNDPRYIQQLALFAADADDLAERDVIILTDTDPDAESDLRTRLRPRGFMLVIMGKDGEVELRKPAPWDVREISRTIDKMPLRQQELYDERFNP